MFRTFLIVAIALSLLLAVLTPLALLVGLLPVTVERSDAQETIVDGMPVPGSEDVEEMIVEGMPVPGMEGVEESIVVNEMPVPGLEGIEEMIVNGE